MNSSTNTILAIESAICGGSLSLMRNGVEIINWIGSSNVSKAEDLLINIDRMFNETGTPRNALTMISASAGPGSFTGIRIGLATALGLSRGLGIEMSSESALKAMVVDLPYDEVIIAALPVGRNAVCIQTFNRAGRGAAATDEPRTITEAEFNSLASSTEIKIVGHNSLLARIENGANIIDFGSNLAHVIGIACLESNGAVTAPLFISKSF